MRGWSNGTMGAVLVSLPIKCRRKQRIAAPGGSQLGMLGASSFFRESRPPTLLGWGSTAFDSTEPFEGIPCRRRRRRRLLRRSHFLHLNAGPRLRGAFDFVTQRAGQGNLFRGGWRTAAGAALCGPGQTSHGHFHQQQQQGQLQQLRSQLTVTVGQAGRTPEHLGCLR